MAISSEPASAPKSKLFRGGTQQRASVNHNDDSPLATQLERDLSMSSGVTRWLYWLEAIEKAKPADFPRLARLSQGNPTATRFLALRWVELDAGHLFDTLFASPREVAGLPFNELASALFEAWPKRDPDAAIAALGGTDSAAARNWRMRVATVMVEKDVERGLRLMSEWHIENYGPRMTAVAQWAPGNPQHAAEFTLRNPAGYASQLAMETIGKEWAKIHPAPALEFAANKPGELGAALAAATLKEWTARNLTDAADWLTAADTKTRNRLSAPFVETWAKEDAAAALKWCQENLAGSALASAVGGVVKGAAEKNLGAAAELVSGMNPSPARAEAAAAVARKWFPEFSSDKPVKQEAVTWLGGLDSDSAKRVLDQVLWSWSTSDPKSLATYLAASQNEQVPPHAYSIVARELARKNPSEAIEWATKLPNNRGLSAGGEAFSEWRRAQPEEAAKWLNELPSTDARRQTFFESAIRSLAYDPQAAEQLAAMAATDCAAARTVIKTMSLPEDRRSRLLDVLKPR
ncbi:MAG: hypothetical protein FJ403_17225 [Verrucomicrobia bacterium]|nr:hypothetical protein [Verrucomicrobiota bacterium]